MKKGNLLVLTVPGMLLAASCGAGVNQKTSAIKSSSNDQVTVTIACVNCLVDNKSVFTGKYDVNSSPSFSVTADSQDPNAILPEKSGVDFRVAGVKDENFTFEGDENKKTATLNFTVPNNDVTVVIDATVQCVDFVVQVNSTEEGKNIVKFNFNGAVNHVDWGDGTVNNDNEHQYKTTGDKPVKVYGKLSSIWFTEKDEPTSNSTLLAAGNEFINTFKIHHSVNTLPNYALNGCSNLARVYIGGSVQTIGKKVFQLAEDRIRELETTIYCYPMAKPDGWDEEWANAECPVCYGMVNPGELEKVHTDQDNSFNFRVINAKIGSRIKQVAMITGIGKKPEELSEGLIIPATVQDETKNLTYPVYSIAPFAFKDLRGDQFKATIGFADKSTNITEIGDYAFAELNNTNIDLHNIRSTSTIRIGRGAFKYTGAGDIIFPEYTGEYEGKAPDLIIDDEAFFGAQNIKSIRIPTDSFKLKEIHKSAFENCIGLGSFTCDGSNFPDSVTMIGDMAFASCYELFNKASPKIFITESVTKMGEDIFLNLNYKDASIRVAYEEGKTPEGWSENWNRLNRKTGDKLAVSWGFVKEIVVDNCTYEIIKKDNVETATLVGYQQPKTEVNVTIPEYVVDPDDSQKQYQVVAIGDNAFNNNDKVVSVVVPKSVAKVGYHAFANCSPLLKVFYKGSAKDVKSGWDPEWTFPNVSRSDVGAALYTNYDSTISKDDLYNSQFDLAKEITTENGTYNASILEYQQDANKVIIPATIKDSSDQHTYNITSIGGKSFMNKDLTAGLEFADNDKLTSIGAGAFAMTKLPEAPLTLPESIEEIGCGVFAMANGVTSIDLSSTKISSVPLGAFVGAPNLTAVNLPDEVDIGEYAFAMCTSLVGVDLSKASMTAVPKSLFAMCSSYKGKLDKDGNPTGDLQLPTGITSIEEQAFTMSGVKKVVLSKNANLESIGDSAFAGCANLESVTLPSNFKGFGENVFGFVNPKANDPVACSSLKEIDLSAITSEAVKIPSTFFGYGKVPDDLPAAFKTGGDGKIYVPAKFLPDYQKYFQDVLGADNLDHIQAK